MLRVSGLKLDLPHQLVLDSGGMVEIFWWPEGLCVAAKVIAKAGGTPNLNAYNVYPFVTHGDGFPWNEILQKLGHES